MKRWRLVVLIVLWISTHLSAVAGEDCSKCRCTSYPVAKGCESCCRLGAARDILRELINTPERVIPKEIAANAKCVAVVPGFKKGPFIIGAQYSRGVVTCRTGHGWSAPAFIRVAGGSFGFQSGDQATDLVLVAEHNRGFQDLLRDRFRIGVDASAAAGPVGRSDTASTDLNTNADLLSYSHAKGLFAGVDLDGASISQDREGTDAFYGSPQSFEQILKGEVPAPDNSKPFLQAVAEYFHSSP